jgi:FtsH-binding integral membrane protein
MRLALFWTGTVGFGISLGPLISMANVVDPTIIQTALVSTSTVFAATTLMSMRMPKDNMMKYGAVLGSGLISLLLLQLSSMGIQYFYGPNQFTSLVSRVDMYGGIAMFTAFIAYDTHKAISDYENGKGDHL